MRTAIPLLALLLAACPSGNRGDFVTCTDGDGDGFCPGSDCDDTDAAVHPGAEELCNDRDDDCDGALSPGELEDRDMDGSPACADCDDDDGTRFPGNTEVCDGVDNDCDGIVPDDEADADQDGQLACVDCQDENPDVAPGLPEVACDGVDTNCDGVLDVMEEDGDGDGWTGCEGDCGPDDPAIHPGADEGCNTVDNDCDGALAPDEVDHDSDGYPPCADDCDDSDPLVSPGDPELCDGLDNDCNGLLDGVGPDGLPEDTDADGDSFSPCTGDCDDNDPARNPEAYDLLDGGDGNCDGVVGADAVGIGPWTGPEADILAFMDLDCTDHGRTLGTVGFDVGPVVTPIVEAGVDASTEEPTGPGVLVYSGEFDGVLPRGGGQFARSEGPALSVSLHFDPPQTMVAVASQVFEASTWSQFEATLRYQGSDLATGVLYANDDPGLNQWALRGFLSLSNVPFDEVILSGPGFQQWVLDDLWLCQ